jgi:hypothetical protein
LTNHDLIESLAARIERAYALRMRDRHDGRATSKVWSAAAHMLFKAHINQPSLPIDPELFVVVQPLDGPCVEPWLVLLQPEAIQRYRDAVSQLIRDLAAELRAEVARGERRIRRGAAPEQVLSVAIPSLSPLSCFIVASRARRPDLVERFLEGAQRQDRGCPLYRLASRGLLPAKSYPEAPSSAALVASLEPREGSVSLLN